MSDTNSKQRNFMKECLSDALADYLDAFTDDSNDFLIYHSFDADKNLQTRRWSRGEFLSLALKAAEVLRRKTKSRDVFFLNCFGCNHYADLAFRLAATMTGRVPATVNWQADTLERIVYKIEMTAPELILTDTTFSFELIEAVKKKYPEIPVYDVSALDEEKEMSIEDCEKSLGVEKTRIVIFTSGTTGRPKGVRLPYRAYRTNRATFDRLLAISPSDDFGMLIVNPMHHTNSTAITDWGMRRPGTTIHLVQKYSTSYWKLLSDAADVGYDRLLAPVVARHFDFLENLVSENRLPTDIDILKKGMRKVDFLIGSAPVGPTTVNRLLEYAGRVPTVRFGSTETCLQVLGIPAEMTNEQRLTALKKGWNHVWNGERKTGYYIGRPTKPFNECTIVESVDRNDDNYLKRCVIGKPGYLITRGGNIMSEYLNNRKATEEALDDGWYLGLRDICFALSAGTDETLDYYWLSRDSFMLIKGGSNYAYDQINSELKNFVEERYGLSEPSFDLAVVGMKIDSEHEDSCCVIFELKNEEAEFIKDDINSSFLNDAAKQVSKGAKPDYLIFDKIPRNFKGAFMVEEARALFRDAAER